MKNHFETKKELIRMSGTLREVLTIHDNEGNLLHKIITPLMIEFRARDVVQIMLGAGILAIPIGFTEETWRLGETLPLLNVLGILLMSLFFLSTFVFYNYYREHIHQHWDEFLKRVFVTYFFSFLIVALILTLIQRAPWGVDFMLALKRVILVAFPASMSASVADLIK